MIYGSNNPFSFKRGFFSFFGLRERYLDVIKQIILSRSDADAIKNDWYNIANDIRKSIENNNIDYPTQIDEKVKQQLKRQYHACE